MRIYCFITLKFFVEIKRINGPSGSKVKTFSLQIHIGLGCNIILSSS